MKPALRIIYAFVFILVVTVCSALFYHYLLDGPRVFSVTPNIVTSTSVITEAPSLESRSTLIKGRILTSDDRPIAGVLVTAISGDKHRRLSVYSGEQGNYQLTINFNGTFSLRARTPYFKDVIKNIDIENTESISVDFIVEKQNSSQELSTGLSASAHAASLTWPNSDVKNAFISQCHYCHQMGNELTRRPRRKEEWTQVVNRMEGYLVTITGEQKEGIRDTLANGFTGNPVKAIQSYDLSPELYRARIEEWTAGDGMSFIHDADIGFDGKLYGVDEGHDVIWILNRLTGQVERVALPDSELPVGGRFSGLALPIGIFSGKHGPHSMAQSKDGRFWITNALSASLISFEPKSREFAVYPLGGDALYAHTIRIDNKGIIWFTLAVSNQVARLDPKTATFTVIDLPSNTILRWITDAVFPLVLDIAAYFPRQNLHLRLSHHDISGEGRNILNLPYGIDINPLDGSVWYSKLYGNKIGRIDPETLAITEFDTPARGPRRPRFDAQGILWIPSFDEGVLLRFDSQTHIFKNYALPTLAPNEYETPYALNVHPHTGEVWISSNLSDRIFRFFPASERFVSYPSPTRVSYLRDLVFTEDGKVCSVHSNLPAYAIEGGVPAFICLDPDGVDAENGIDNK